MQEQHSYPIFTESWGADEELLLIEGLTLYGLGNWQDAAEHVGTRTREECEQHYLEVWIGESKADSGVAAVSGGILRVAWWNQRRGGGVFTTRRCMKRTRRRPYTRAWMLTSRGGLPFLMASNRRDPSHSTSTLRRSSRGRSGE